MIGHTQPRRIAAHALASRLATELGSPLGDLVGYQVRFVDRTSPRTLIKLMTDGVLLRELERDPWLAALRHADSRRSARAQPQSRFPARHLPAAADPAPGAAGRRHVRDDRDAALCRVSSVARRSSRSRAAVTRSRSAIGRSIPTTSRRRRSRGRAWTRSTELALDARGITGDTLVFPAGRAADQEALELLQARAAGRRELLPLYSRLSTAGAGADLRAACGAARRARHQRRGDLAHDSRACAS